MNGLGRLMGGEQSDVHRKYRNASCTIWSALLSHGLVGIVEGREDAEACSHKQEPLTGVSHRHEADWQLANPPRDLSNVKPRFSRDRLKPTYQFMPQQRCRFLVRGCSTS